MSYPRLPSGLEKPFRSGFQLSAGDGRSMTSPEAGPPRVRSRMSRSADPVSLTVPMTRGELGLFQDFCKNTLKNYHLPFIMPDPITDGWPICDEDDVPLTDEDDVPLLMTQDWLVTFAQQLPSIAIAGIDFHVSFQLLVMPV